MQNTKTLHCFNYDRTLLKKCESLVLKANCTSFCKPTIYMPKLLASQSLSQSQLTYVTDPVTTKQWIFLTPTSPGLAEHIRAVGIFLYLSLADALTLFQLRRLIMPTAYACPVLIWKCSAGLILLASVWLLRQQKQHLGPIL